MLSKNNQKENVDKKFWLGIILIIIALVFSATSTIIQKYASVLLDKFWYIAVSYFYNIFFSLGLVKRFESNWQKSTKNESLIIGFFIGIFNFIGFYMILNAFEIGSLSLVASINSLSFVIWIVLSILVYKEKITKRSIIAIILSVIVVILLRM